MAKVKSPLDATSDTSTPTPAVTPQVGDEHTPTSTTTAVQLSSAPALPALPALPQLTPLVADQSDNQSNGITTTKTFQTGIMYLVGNRILIAEAELELDLAAIFAKAKADLVSGGSTMGTFILPPGVAVRII